MGVLGSCSLKRSGKVKLNHESPLVGWTEGGERSYRRGRTIGNRCFLKLWILPLSLDWMRIWSRLREVLLSSEVCRTSPKKTNWRRCNSFLEHLQGIDVNFFRQIFLDLCDGLRHSEGNALSLHDESQETLTGSSILILYSDHWGEYLPTETEFVPVNVFFPSPLLNRCASFFPF